MDDLDWLASRIVAVKKEIAVLERELGELEERHERALREQAREYMRAANEDRNFTAWRQGRRGR